MSSFTTALCLTPEDPLLIERINQIRDGRDRAYPRWMPHINFLFPFVSQDRFGEIMTTLEPILDKWAPFEVKLDQIGCFVQRNQVTFHAKPSDEGEKILQTLYQEVQEVLKIQVKGADWHPHLTLAQCKKSEREQVEAELTAWLKADDGLNFTVDGMILVERDPEMYPSVFSPMMVAEFTNQI